ncbi:MAG: 3-oxoacyl-ACP reductase [Blastopirellula sp.]|nr:MAG: 3-oxoacyl-ACP reductase [Blastopirellula sp.]
MNPELSPPVALVTGAGSGIGRATSVALANAGFQLVLAGRTIENLDETAKLISSQTGAPLPCSVVTDITSSQSVRDLFELIQKRFGKLDLLFNNAGVSAPDVPFEQLDDESWNACVDTNLTGAFYSAREAFRLMKQQTPQGGRIINNGSVSSQTPRPNSAPYVATKHAITGLTKSISLDGRPYNIACGQIDIGNASTDMTDRMAKGVKQADGTTAIEPTIDVKHIAQAIVYMASLPLDANVPHITVMANQMPLVGRG